MANDAAHNTATTEPLDRATPDVSLDVAAVAVSGFASGGNAALGFVSDATTVTIRTDGTHDFGSVAPVFSFNFDAGNSADGLRIRKSDIPAGPGTIVEDDSLEVIAEPKYPGGMAIRIGTSGTDLGSTSYGKFNVSHPLSQRVFESRSTYMRRAAAERVVDYWLGDLPTPGGDPYAGAAWQVKTVWNQADYDFNSSDTDFFIKVLETANEGGFGDTPILSTNSVGTIYGPGNTGSIARSANYKGAKMPLDEPITTEFAWDQGDVSVSVNEGEIWVHCYGAETGVLTEGSETGVTLAEANGPVKNIDTLTYPGYIRGFQRPLDLDFRDNQVYRQVGPGAYCRVAICDDATYLSSKKRILLPPTSWTSTEIVGSLPGWCNDLSDFAGDYLCIMDINNTQIGTGVQI